MKHITFSALALLMAASMSSGTAQGPAKVDPPPRANKDQVRAAGVLQPQDIVDIGSSVSGQIVKLMADYNTKVEAQQELAQIDSTSYEMAAKAARADLDRAAAERELAEIKLVHAKQRFERAELLHQKRAISSEEHGEARLAVETGKASVRVAEAAVRQAQVRLDQAANELRRTTIRSPIAGIVIDRRVNVGQTVVSTLAPSLFLIASDLKKLQLHASVSEGDIGRIMPGQPAVFTVSSHPGKKFKGAVAAVRLHAATVQGRVVYTVVLSVDNSDGRLLPFLTADVTIDVADRK